MELLFFFNKHRYGQTSSGKTYTMTGDPNDLYDESIRGIIPRTVDALFAGIQEADETTEFTLAVRDYYKFIFLNFTIIFLLVKIFFFILIFADIY